MKYATNAAIKRAVALARECDIEIGAFELTADGTIRILTPGTAETNAKLESAFDRLEREGGL